MEKSDGEGVKWRAGGPPLRDEADLFERQTGRALELRERVEEEIMVQLDLDPRVDDADRVGEERVLYFAPWQADFPSWPLRLRAREGDGAEKKEREGEHEAPDHGSVPRVLHPAIARQAGARIPFGFVSGCFSLISDISSLSGDLLPKGTPKKPIKANA
jgi:hypothetical protein